MSPLQTAKYWLASGTQLSKDALHVYLALGLFFGAMLLFGWRARDWKPWLLVLAVELVNEAWDIRDGLVYPDVPFQPLASIGDIANTMFWPTMILLLARYTSVFARKR